MAAVLLFGLPFQTEDPEGESDAVNIFMFLDLSLLAGTEAALVARHWDTESKSNTLMSYTNTALLMTKQRISPILVWEGSVKLLNQWLMLIDVIIGPPELHSAICEL